MRTSAYTALAAILLTPAALAGGDTGTLQYFDSDNCPTSAGSTVQTLDIPDNHCHQVSNYKSFTSCTQNTITGGSTNGESTDGETDKKRRDNCAGITVQSVKLTGQNCEYWPNSNSCQGVLQSNPGCISGTAGSFTCYS